MWQLLSHSGDMHMILRIAVIQGLLGKGTGYQAIWALCQVPQHPRETPTWQVVAVQAPWDEVTAIKPKYSEAVTQEKELGIRCGQNPKPDTTAPHMHPHTLEKQWYRQDFPMFKWMWEKVFRGKQHFRGNACKENFHRAWERDTL